MHSLSYAYHLYAFPFPCPPLCSQSGTIVFHVAGRHATDVRLSEGRGQNNQQPTPNDNNKRVVVFLCGSGARDNC